MARGHQEARPAAAGPGSGTRLLGTGAGTGLLIALPALRQRKHLCGPAGIARKAVTSHQPARQASTGPALIVHLSLAAEEQQSQAVAEPLLELVGVPPALGREQRVGAGVG